MSVYSYKLSEVFDLPFSSIIPLYDTALRLQLDEAISIVAEGKIISSDSDHYKEACAKRGEVFAVHKELKSNHMTLDAHCKAKDLAKWIVKDGKKHIKGSR